MVGLCEGRTITAPNAEYTGQNVWRVTVPRPASVRRRTYFLGGPLKVAKGRAKVVLGSQDAKLKVSFFGPFYGDYWVLDHADDYSWSIVGEPSGRYLWILTRQVSPDAATRDLLQTRVKALGYDMSLIRQTAH